MKKGYIAYILYPGFFDVPVEKSFPTPKAAVTALKRKFHGESFVKKGGWYGIQYVEDDGLSFEAIKVLLEPEYEVAATGSGLDIVPIKKA